MLNRSVSEVDDACVVEVAFDFHVVGELILSVESAGQTFSVQLLGMDAANGSGTLCFPLFDFTLCTNGWVRAEILS